MKPHMGQGAAMAFEDAVILARSIAACEEDVPAAFRLYEASRIERTSRVQRESHDNTWMKLPERPGLGLWLRRAGNADGRAVGNRLSGPAAA